MTGMPTHTPGGLYPPIYRSSILTHVRSLFFLSFSRRKILSVRYQLRASSWAVLCFARRYGTNNLGSYGSTVAF